VFRYLQQHASSTDAVYLDTEQSQVPKDTLQALSTIPLGVLCITGRGRSTVATRVAAVRSALPQVSEVAGYSRPGGATMVCLRWRSRAPVRETHVEYQVRGVRIRDAGLIVYWHGYTAGWEMAGLAVDSVVNGIARFYFPGNSQPTEALVM
jgi:hypothetical protein